MKVTISMPMKKIEERGGALKPAPDKPVFQLLDADHPLKLYIGREITGEYLFLLVDPEQPPRLKSLRSVRITSLERPDGQWSLILRLAQTELAGVFALLCEDLVASSKHLARGSSGVRLVARRLANWRRLMEEGGGGLLDPAAVRGLVGELLVLNHYFIDRLGPEDAVNAWRGPFGADQDFQLPQEAWEVKTIHTDSTVIEIASETQLDSASREIFLAVVPLEESVGEYKNSLNDLISRLMIRLEDQPIARDMFDARLVELRYMSRSEYDAPGFSIGKVRTFHVQENFPRIRVKDILKGVAKVRYKVQLDACKPYEIETPFTTE